MDVSKFGKMNTTKKRSRSQLSPVDDSDDEPLHPRFTNSQKKNRSSNLALPLHKRLYTSELSPYLSDKQKDYFGEAMPSSTQPDREIRRPTVVESTGSDGSTSNMGNKVSSISSNLDDPTPGFSNELSDSFSYDERNVRASRIQKRGAVDKRVSLTKVTPLVFQMVKFIHLSFATYI